MLLSSVAAYYYSNASRYPEIAQLNHLSEKDLRKLQIGSQILIKDPLRSGIPAPGFAVPPEEVSNQNGSNPQAVGGDPVNTITGNFFYRHKDLEVKGKIPITFERTYNSRDRSLGPLGNSWAFSYYTKLLFYRDKENEVGVLRPDGKVDFYTKNPDGTFTGQFGSHDLLRQNPDQSYSLITKQNISYEFEETGKLKEI
ncbi:DUF6531 domain-containing protein, partial [Effusibacillus consociatus]